ncbi:MAG: GNAT family N-acetyltransferase [Gemmatimonadetes bacterium]|nr:GNAT family N-acetyltransferase [Gemmatimonadota bacterium]
MSSIRDRNDADFAALHGLYEQLVTNHVPHCWPVDAQRFGEALRNPPSVARDGWNLTEHSVLVADDARGFIHVGLLTPPKVGDSPLGMILFLGYPRTQRSLGSELLAAGEEWILDHGVRHVATVAPRCRYPFYGFPHCHLSDHLDHIQALLQAHSYSNCGGEIFLDWLEMQPTPKPPPPEIECDISVEEVVSHCHLPGLKVQAHLDGKPIATCLLINGGEGARCPEAEAFAFCDWIGVQEPWQGKGLGRHLLWRALTEARNVGYRHAAISTSTDNHRAFTFYSHYGFHAVDRTYQFERHLDQ